MAADKKANKRDVVSFKSKIIELFYPNYIWVFIVLLRKVELYRNKSRSFVDNALYAYYLFRFKAISVKLGFSIPPNVFGPGLSIPHYGTIIINASCKIGKNCRIHASTNIGASGGLSSAPKIGDNVYIAPGAKIFGDISIPNNCAIGANAVVNKSFFKEGMLIAGVPASEIAPIEITNLIKHI